MKKTALHKDIYRTITGTLPRFLSIFFIVVLGVAFYSGIRVTQKDMHITADHQFDGSRLMDVKVMGTLGISEENLTALRKLKNVQSVEGGHSVDVIARKQGSDEEHAIKVMGKTDKLNQITIIDGKLPQASGECLVDEWYAQQNDLKTGDVLNLSWHWNGNVVRLYCGATIRIFLRYLYRSLSDCEGSEARESLQ